jgi:hypothetical protein
MDSVGNREALRAVRAKNMIREMDRLYDSVQRRVFDLLRTAMERGETFISTTDRIAKEITKDLRADFTEHNYPDPPRYYERRKSPLTDFERLGLYQDYGRLGGVVRHPPPPIPRYTEGEEYFGMDLASEEEPKQEASDQSLKSLESKDFPDY